MISLLRYVCKHPLCRSNRTAAINRVLRWQLGSRILGNDVVVPFTNRTRLMIRRGQAGATGNLYCGLHEFEDMAFLIHLLREEDLFIDVGANIGSYTILASGHVGARTLAFEPVPASFERLRENVRLNLLDDVVNIQNKGIGKNPGMLRFTLDADTANHVVSEDEPTQDRTVEVLVDTLDSLTTSLSPRLIKIDVEGFEANVIGGGQRIFRDPTLKAVLVELNGSGMRYGFDDCQVHQAMLDFGFASYCYEPFQRTLTDLNGCKNSTGNTLYLRDLAFVVERVSSAETIELPWISF